MGQGRRANRGAEGHECAGVQPDMFHFFFIISFFIRMRFAPQLAATRRTLEDIEKRIAEIERRLAIER